MENKIDPKRPCPCGSGNAYAACCRPFHQGQLPDTALKLMRSRYSAYVLCLPAYIMQTTHPSNPQFSRNTTEWAQQISEFCLNTKFKKLDILNFQETGDLATVTFTAHLVQNKKRGAVYREKPLYKNRRKMALLRRSVIHKLIQLDFVHF